MYASLHCHDEYSLLDGAGTAAQHVEAAKAAGVAALANTNHGTLAGSLHHLRACREGGIVPISGVEVYFRPNRRVQGQKEWLKVYFHLTLLAKNGNGWRNLMLLVSESHKTGFYGRACCDLELLEKYHEGLICLTGCLGGQLCKSINAEQDREAEAWLRYLQRLFKDDLFCEIMGHGIPAQAVANIESVRMAQRHGIPTAVTLDEHYPTEEWAPTQDVLLMIATNQTRKKREKKREEGEDVYEFGTKTFFHQTEARIRAEFAAYHPGLSQQIVDESLRNTLVCAMRTTPFLIDRSEKMPAVSVPRDITPEAHLRRLAYEGLRRRGYITDKAYTDQLEFELDAFARNGQTTYILLVEQVTTWAKSTRLIPKRNKKTGDLIYPEGKKKPIMIGPGRGCLTGDVDVWTPSGFKRLDQINPGDSIMTHTGVVAPVRDTFAYEVDEDIVTIKSYLGDSTGVSMTSDHEVLVEKARFITNKGKIAQGYKYEKPLGNPEWLPAGEVEIGDLVCVPIADCSTPARVIDLADYAGEHDLIEDDWVVERKASNSPCRASKKDLKRRYGIDQRRLKLHADDKVLYPDVSNALRLEGFTDESWRAYLDSHRYDWTRVKRFVKVDEGFAELMGFWAANGWLRSDSSAMVGWAEQRSKSNGTASLLISSVTGLSVKTTSHKTSDLLQLEIRSRCWARLLSSLAPEYNHTALTKSLPDEIVYGLRPIREAALHGLWRGDGSIKERNSYTTSSIKLMHQVRTLLWSVGVGNGVSIDDRIDTREEFKNRSRSWKIIANRRWDADTPNQAGSCRRGDLLMMRVRDADRQKTKTRVYDLEVDHPDTSYLTSSFAVHNSAGSSVVVWSLGITNFNPRKYRTLFERFVNPNRKGLPDIDIDFSPDRVDEVENFIKAIYGKDRVVDIIAHSTFGPRAALTDVGRVLSLPYAHIKQVTKGIDVLERAPLAELRVVNSELDRLLTQYPELAENASRIQGSVARKSEHPGGILVLPGSVDEYIPVERTGGQKGKMLSAYGERSGPGNDLISQLGLIKIDVLRVAELAKQQHCVDLIAQRTGEVIDLDALPVHDDPYAVDPKVMQAFKDGYFVGVFQWSGVAGQFTRRVGPDNILELAAINAGIRPGARGKGMDIEFAERKNGHREFEYLPGTESFMDDTFGVLLFQEQILQIAHKIAGYSLSDADDFRKIVSKLYRDPVYAKATMDTHRGRFVEGAAKNVGFELAEQTFDTIYQFCSYAFNRPHANGYSLLGYRDMHLKVYYPREFYASFLSKGLSKVTNKRALQKQEAAREMRSLPEYITSTPLNILPPDINESGRDYTVVENGIRLGLEAVKHIGPSAAAAIEEHRPFADYADFERRIPRKAVNAGDQVSQRAALIMAGAFDRWGMRDGYTEERIDELERELIGMSLTSVHSIQRYAHVIEGRFWSTDEVEAAPDGTRVTIMGEVTSMHEMNDSKGNAMAFVDLAYGPNTWSITCFSYIWAEYEELVKSRRPLMITGVVERYTNVAKGIVNRLGIRVESLPPTADGSFSAPIQDLSEHIEAVGDVEEHLGEDSVYQEDLAEWIDENTTQPAAFDAARTGG